MISAAHGHEATQPTALTLSPAAAASRSAEARITEVCAALAPRSERLTRDIHELILREISQLRGDRRVQALLQASVAENVATLLHVLQHGIDLANVHAPAAAAEYARRLAQRDVPVAALLRAYRIGSTRFQDACLQELVRHTDDAQVVSVAGMRIAGVTAAYIDKVSEEVLSAYESEKENWLRNLGAARAARVRALLGGERADLDAAEAMLGYRLRQQHVGVLAWAAAGRAGGNALDQLERAIADVAARAGCEGRAMFVPQDEFTAWAWLPLGAQRSFAAHEATTGLAGGEAGLRFAFGSVAGGVAGFRRSHQQALSAYAVALAAGGAGPLVTTFDEVAPLALMSGSVELLRDWVIETLGALAADDEHHARLRATLGVFLAENGSYKATAERLTLHKNTVQYRVRRAEESLGRPVGEDRLRVELALLAARWLGPAVLSSTADAAP